jgi:hypothetical protein
LTPGSTVGQHALQEGQGEKGGDGSLEDGQGHGRQEEESQEFKGQAEKSEKSRETGSAGRGRGDDAGRDVRDADGDDGPGAGQASSAAFADQAQLRHTEGQPAAVVDNHISGANLKFERFSDQIFHQKLQKKICITFWTYFSDLMALESPMKP